MPYDNTYFTVRKNRDQKLRDYFDEAEDYNLEDLDDDDQGGKPLTIVTEALKHYVENLEKWQEVESKKDNVLTKSVLMSNHDSTNLPN